jgi:hypothetical protein
MITVGTVGATFTEHSDPKIVMDRHVNRAIKASIERHTDVYEVQYDAWEGVYSVVADEEYFRALPRTVHFYIVHQAAAKDAPQEWTSGAVSLRVFG